MTFRPMRRFKQQLTEEQCRELLRREPRGVLSVLGDGGYPYGLPINFLYDENRLYFHCALEGHKLDAIRRHDRVSLCVYDEGCREAGNWPLHIRSVIAFGRVREVHDPEVRLEKARLLGLKYYPTAEAVEAELQQSLDRMLLLEMIIEHMTGKIVKES